jgi:uncharacterized repeat protein (TIGR01451 family)
MTRPLMTTIRLLAAVPLALFCSCRGTLPLVGNLRDAGTAESVASPVSRTTSHAGGATSHIGDEGATAAPSPPLPRSAAAAQHYGSQTQPQYPVQPAQYVPQSLPPSAWTGPGMPGMEMPAGEIPPHTHAVPGHCPHCNSHRGPFQFSSDVHAGIDVTGMAGAPGLSWVPDGISCPWPKDEFICDGGDKNHDVIVKRDWTIVGLDQEDTVAHYDTVDGRTEVTASNCVCIYAPRFAAVRQVSSPILYEGHERIAGVEKPLKLNVHEENRGPKTAIQPEQLVAQLGLDQTQAFRDKIRGTHIEQTLQPILAADAFLPHENLKLIMRGEYDATEKARLAERTAAAVTWTQNQAVQILIDGQQAVQAKGLLQPQETIVYELDGKPCLRICKIADKSDAQVGEIITFTLRFDNLGDQTVGNVTIIDHLMPRLEYVEGSAQSTLASEFKPGPIVGGETTVLRWEINDPLKVNEGGVIRFQAKVR